MSIVAGETFRAPLDPGSDGGSWECNSLQR